MAGKPLLLSVFNTLDAGGAQSRFITLANDLGPTVKHVLIAMDGRHGALEKLDRSVDVEVLRVPVKKGALFGNAPAFLRVLNSRKPDCLITHNWGTIEWALAQRFQSVRHVHIEDGFGPEEAAAQFARRIVARRFLLARSEVIVPSRGLETIALQDWHVPRARLHYIPNGIDCTRFMRSNSAPNNPMPVVGTVAALRPEKNLARLLHAFASVRAKTPCRLAIVGDGPERERLQSLAATLGLSEAVTFHGHIADPSSLYGGFDVFALSSDTEQMPYTIIEAMAARCAIAATDVGDVRDMVAVENKPYVASDLARSLAALLEDETLRMSLGQANTVKANTAFDQRGMLDSLAALYLARERVPRQTSSDTPSHQSQGKPT